MEDKTDEHVRVCFPSFGYEIRPMSTHDYAFRRKEKWQSTEN